MRKEFIKLTGILLIFTFVFLGFIINLYASGALYSKDNSLVLAMGQKPQTEEEKAKEAEEKALEAMSKKHKKEVLKAQKEAEKRRKKLERELRMKREEEARKKEAIEKEKQRQELKRQKEVEHQKLEEIKKMYTAAQSLYRNERYQKAIVAFSAVVKEARGFSDRYVRCAERYIERAKVQMQKLEEKKRAAFEKQRQEELEKQKREEEKKQAELERQNLEKEKQAKRQKEEKLATLYSKAKNLYRDKNYTQAIQVFQNLISEEADSNGRYTKKALKYLEMIGDAIQAQKERLALALEKQRQEELEQKKKEEAKLRAQERQKAIEGIKEIYLQGKGLYSKGAWAESIAIFQNVILEEQKLNEKIYSPYAQRYIERAQEKIEKAEKEKLALQKEQEEKKKLAEIKELYLRGKKLYEEGKYEEAIAAFEKVIELEGNPRVLYTPYAQKYIEKSKQKIKEREEQELAQRQKEEKEAQLKRIRQKQLEQEEIQKRQERLAKEQKLREERKKKASKEAKEKAAKERKRQIQERKQEITQEEQALEREVALDEKEMMLGVKQTQVLPKKEKVSKAALPKVPLVKIPEIRKKLQTPVTADFKDVDLAYVLNFLSDSTGVNIIPGSSVKAEERKVSMRIKDLPLESALKYILKNQGLTYRIEEDAVWVATPKEMKTEELETKIYFLNQGSGLYAQFSGTAIGVGTELGSVAQMEKVKTFKDTLEAAVDWPKGSRIVLDERTGALIVTNTPSNLQIIEEILYKIDISPVQVLVEARFIEIEMTDLSELGIEWKLTDDFKADTKKKTGGIKTKISKDSGVDWSVFSRQSEGFNLTYAGVLSHPQFEAVLHALEESKKSKTLSAPKVTTMNNQQATIKVVDEWRYPTRYDTQLAQYDINGDGDYDDAGESTWVVVPIEFVTRDIGILLHVTPSVGVNKDIISLALIPEVSEGEKDYFEYSGGVKLPKFTSRSVSTNVIINNGETVVLGGLIKETKVKKITKVPLLGDIPILGLPFRKTTTDIVRKNLLIFVTARIITPTGAELITE
jgi:type II secretory pathway component GspD/PulD (secretin)